MRNFEIHVLCQEIEGYTGVLFKNFYLLVLFFFQQVLFLAKICFFNFRLSSILFLGGLSLHLNHLIA